MKWSSPKLSQILRQGGVAVIPTDTIYGVVGSALNKKTAGRIYRLRKRNPEKPCIILIGGESELKKFGVELTKQQQSELAEIWPGPISVVLNCQNPILEYLHRGTNTLAFRVPADKKLRAFLKETGPLIAPSANIEGMLPSKNIEEARVYFGDNVDYYMDAGEIVGKSSKVIRIGADGVIAVLRE